MSQCTVMCTCSNLVKCRNSRAKYTVEAKQHRITKAGKGSVRHIWENTSNEQRSVCRSAEVQRYGSANRSTF
jgi:hypothetical protein